MSPMGIPVILLYESSKCWAFPHFSLSSSSRTYIHIVKWSKEWVQTYLFEGYLAFLSIELDRHPKRCISCKRYGSIQKHARWMHGCKGVHCLVILGDKRAFPLYIEPSFHVQKELWVLKFEVLQVLFKKFMLKKHDLFSLEQIIYICILLL
jgi:hypothetical protein